MRPPQLFDQLAPLLQPLHLGGTFLPRTKDRRQLVELVHFETSKIEILVELRTRQHYESLS